MQHDDFQNLNKVILTLWKHREPRIPFDAVLKQGILYVEFYMSIYKIPCLK